MENEVDHWGVLLPNKKLVANEYRDVLKDWRKNKRSGIKAERIRKARIARKVLRGIRDGENWVVEWMKARRTKKERLELWAKGEYHTGKNRWAKKSFEETGMGIWKRRGLL